MSSDTGPQRITETVVRKTRRLPTEGEVHVGLGENVSPDSIIASCLKPNPDIRDVNIYNDLRTYGEDARRHMMKGLGDEVRAAEVLARRRGFLGFGKYESVSPIDGTIEHLSYSSGRAFIRGKPIHLEVSAHIPGEVIEVFPGEGAVVETEAAMIQGVFGVGGESHGELAMATDSPDEVLSKDRILDSHLDKVIVGGAQVLPGALDRAVEVGVRGVICGGIRQKDLIEFLGYEMGVGITGGEDIGLTLIITEGFGNRPVDNALHRLLTDFTGKIACIDGQTQIRHRMIRPEIILPRFSE